MKGLFGTPFQTWPSLQHVQKCRLFKEKFKVVIVTVVICVEDWQLICIVLTTAFLYTHVHIAAHRHVLADRV